jgi:hypothetical protein
MHRRFSESDGNTLSLLQWRGGRNAAITLNLVQPSNDRPAQPFHRNNDVGIARTRRFVAGLAWPYAEGASLLLCVDRTCDLERRKRMLAEHLRDSEAGRVPLCSDIELDVRVKGARDLRCRFRKSRKFTMGDPSVRRDWPCAWCGIGASNPKETISRCGMQLFSPGNEGN